MAKGITQMLTAKSATANERIKKLVVLDRSCLSNNTLKITRMFPIAVEAGNTNNSRASKLSVLGSRADSGVDDWNVSKGGSGMVRFEEVKLSLSSSSQSG